MVLPRKPDRIINAWIEGSVSKALSPPGKGNERGGSIAFALMRKGWPTFRVEGEGPDPRYHLD